MVDATPKQRLDERGAILVLGIMLGAILVGALFYLVGVGHAVVWREAVQDAADATAFDATAWNARGLNVVVAINIFMAIVMAILLAYRLALLFVTIMAALAGIACVLSVFVPVLAPACSLAPRIAQVAVRMGTREPKLAKKIFKTLAALHKGQALISAATPILSVAQSSIRNSQRPGVGMALAVSTQMLPSSVLDGLAGAAAFNSGERDPGDGDGELDDAFRATKKPPPGNNNNGSCKNKKKCCNNNNGNRGPGNKTRRDRKAKPLMGVPYSLPAEESLDKDRFCDKAAKKMNPVSALMMFLSELAGGGGTPSSDDNAGFLGGIFNALVGGNSPLCGGLAFDPASQAGDVAKKHMKDGCSKRFTSECTNKETPKNDPATGQPMEAFDCSGGQSKAVDRCVTNGGKSGAKKKSGTRSGDDEQGEGEFRASSAKYGEIAWADVWGPMANGTVFTQTWSIVRAKRDDDGINKGIEIAASFGGGTSTPASDDDTNTTLAQAEIYFDTDSDWDSAVDVAMWTMNWRARLRRVHSPLEMALGPIEQQVTRIFTEIFNQTPVQNVLAGTPVAQFFEDSEVSLIPSKVSDALEDLRKETADQGGGAAQWVSEQGFDRAPIIH